MPEMFNSQEMLTKLRESIKKLEALYEKDKEDYPEDLRAQLEAQLSLLKVYLSSLEEAELREIEQQEKMREAIESTAGETVGPVEPEKLEHTVEVRIGQRWYPLQKNKKLNIHYLPMRSVFRSEKTGSIAGGHRGNMIIFPDGRGTTVQAEEPLWEEEPRKGGE